MRHANDECFDSLFGVCIVCYEKRLITELVKRRSGYKCPGCLGVKHANSKINMDIFEPTECRKCKKQGQRNDFFHTSKGYICLQCKKSKK